MIPRQMTVSAITGFVDHGGFKECVEKNFEVRPLRILRRPRSRKNPALGFHYSVVFLGTKDMIQITGGSAEGVELFANLFRKENPGFKPPTQGWVNNVYQCFDGNRIPFANDIKPEVNGRHDFYSWQLYRWAKKYGHSNYDSMDNKMRVYRCNDENRKGQLLIGFLDKCEGPGNHFISGNQLRYICSYGRKLESWAIPVSDVEDITESFWAEYYHKGICAIHGDLVHEWIEMDDLIQCQYCNKTKDTENGGDSD